MKKLALGIIIGILLATAIPAAAEEINKKVTATVRGDFTVEVDGNAVALKNPPLAYDGNSYLPVRELATLLGKDVDFKDGVIKLNTPVQEFSITSQEEYDDAMKKLTDKKAEYEKSITGGVDIALKQLDSDPNSKQKDYDLLHQMKEEYESIIAETEQAIADLKAKYPEYA